MRVSFKRKIKIGVNITVSNFSLFITIRNDFVSVDSNDSVSVTTQNLTHVHMKIFLAMTDTVTSQNIDLSS
jgi:hypothetical protein